MADFLTAFAYSMTNEEPAITAPSYGQVHTDNDGGLVRFGINSNSYPFLKQGTFFTSMVNSEAIRTSQNVYRAYIWNEIKGDTITSQSVASKIFDMAVNQGVVEASKLVQRAVGVNVDGVIGSITIQAINAASESVLLKDLIYWELWLIQLIIDHNPADNKYEEGWTVRAEKLPVSQEVPA